MHALSHMHFATPALLHTKQSEFCFLLSDGMAFARYRHLAMIVSFGRLGSPFGVHCLSMCTLRAVTPSFIQGLSVLQLLITDEHEGCSDCGTDRLHCLTAASS
jgi:hypothetical protein